MISSYLLEQGRIAIKRTRYGLMLFNRNDFIIGRSIDRHGEWCEGELQLLRQLIGPQGRVIAFEPQPLYLPAYCS